jgi:hypothetical protein
MLALTLFRQGDFVWRSDQNAYYDLTGNDSTVLGNWQRRIQTTLRSVNGQTGPDVVLGHRDVGAEPAGSVSSATTSLQAAINTKQPIGDYVLTYALNTVIASLQAAIDSKQAIGDYALTPALNAAVSSLQTAINGKQPTGNYALKSSIRAALDIDNSSVVIPSTSSVVPFNLPAGNITLTNQPQAGTEDGQQLTLVNLSNFWLVLPVFGGNRIVFPRDNLNLIFSSALNGWVAPGAFKGFTCRVFNSGSVSIPANSAAFTAIPFDGTRWDTAGGVMHSNTVNNSRIIAPIAGYYRAWLGLQVGNTGNFAAFIQINGSNHAAQTLTNGGFASIGSGTYFFPAGQYVEFAGRAYNNVATLTRTAQFANEAELTLESL